MTAITQAQFNNVNETLERLSEQVFNEWVHENGFVVTELKSRLNSHDLKNGKLDYITHATFEDVDEGDFDVSFHVKLYSHGGVEFYCLLVDSGDELDMGEDTLPTYLELKALWLRIMQDFTLGDEPVPVYWLKAPEGQDPIKHLNLEQLRPLFGSLDYEGDLFDFAEIKAFAVAHKMESVEVETTCGVKGAIQDFADLPDPEEAMYRCPCCGSSDIRAGNVFDADAVYCNNCGETWAKKYVFAGVDDDGGLASKIYNASKRYFDIQKPKSKTDKSVKNDSPLFAISEAAFKNSAKRLKSLLDEIGVDVGHAKALQTLSQVVYAKPYEEVKATVLNKAGKPDKPTFSYLGFASLNHGGHINRVFNTLEDVQLFLDDVGEEQSFDIDSVRNLTENKDCFFEFDNGSWATITAIK